jgi:class 3 adenylate cyclase/pimeloyl-ACP methyl ester carboxylesterase
VIDKPPVRFTKVRDGWVAYQVAGEGPPDFVLIPAFAGHLDWLWEAPGFSRFMTHLASRGRLIVLDRRGCGCSDGLPAGASYIDEWMFDVLGVLDEVGSERVALIGVDTASPMALMLAAAFPGRVSALVIFEGYARLARAQDYEIGHPPDVMDIGRRTLGEQWGDGTTGSMGNPDIVGDPYLEDLYARLERAAMSRSQAADAISSWLDLDVREVLPSISAPALLFHSSEAPIAVEFGRFVADRLADARLIEYPSRNQNGWFFPEHLPMVLEEIDQFLSIERPAPSGDRVFATILFIDVVSSTERMSDVGDREWRNQLDALNSHVRRSVDGNGGRTVKWTGDGVLASFDGPGRAIIVARDLIAFARHLGLRIRAGVHTGEIELWNDDVTGLAVNIASRVCDVADAGQVLVTRTVKDLVVGSGWQFSDHGERDLKGVREPWQLYLVDSA